MAEVLPLARRSLSVAPPSLTVEVNANGALARRIVATLEADGLPIQNGDAKAPATIRVVSEDLGSSGSLARLRETLGEESPARIVVVSPECGPLGARRAIRAGADSVVLEADLELVLAPAVRAVSVGLSALPVVLRDSADRLALSYREREVLRLVIAGNTNCEIADRLFLAESTVKSHLSSAYRKLGAASRKDAAAMILDPDGGLLEMILGPGQARANGSATAAASS
jgi:DNA-binding NarL/FixJ family response regulator